MGKENKVKIPMVVVSQETWEKLTKEAKAQKTHPGEVAANILEQALSKATTKSKKGG